MFLIKKTMTISAAHYLSHLPYESKCKEMHGHNWKITVFCRSKELNNHGMVVDFTELKKIVCEKLDHKVLNDCGIHIPTAENIALWVCEEINSKKLKSGWNDKKRVFCYRVEVEENEGSTAIYEI